MGQSGGIMPPSPDLPATGEASGMFPTPRVNPFMSAPSPEQGMDEATQINALMRSLYTPEHDFSDRLKGMIDTMPQRPDHISGLRKIGSALVGMAQGPEAQERATFAPYYRQMADFNAKFGPTIKGAELERGNNVNERQMAYQFAQATNAARQQGTREDAEKRRLAKSEADIARDKKKNELNALRADDSNWTLKDDIASGHIFAVHPRLGTHDTGLLHGDMSDLEKAKWRRGDIEAGIQGRIKVKQTPDARANDPNDPRNWQIKNLVDDDNNIIGSIRINRANGKWEPIPPDANIEGGPKPGESPRTSPGASATQDAKSFNNKVEQYKFRHPDQANYFEKDDDGNWKIKEPSKFMGYKTGPSQEVYNQIMGALGMGAGKVGRKGTQRTTKSGTVYYEEN